MPGLAASNPSMSGLVCSSVQPFQVILSARSCARAPFQAKADAAAAPAPRTFRRVQALMESASRPAASIAAGLLIVRSGR